MADAPGNRRHIIDLLPSERIAGVYAVSSAQLGRTRNDKPYLRCIVGDRSGEVTARM